MNLRVKAGLQVFGMLAAAVFAAVVVDILIKTFDANTIVGAAGVGLFTFCFYQLYRIRLSQLEYDIETNRKLRGQ
jgi:hypothetical protein